jgi:1-acyl-sn-glycerol-3-phosphate acyltransferase
MVLPPDPATAAFVAGAAVLARYHRHRVFHLARLGRLIREGRRVILVGNHALDVVDPLLFVAAVRARYGRVPRFMAHALWFRLPVLRDLAARYRLVPAGTLEAAGRALVEDRLLMLFPGGASEAGVRSYRDEPYRLKWGGRLGFLRLALEHDADIVFVASVGNDELYYQSRLPMPGSVARYADGGGERYTGAPLRFGLLGLQIFPAVFPLPVQLTHFVSPPLRLNNRQLARHDLEAFARLHASVWRTCQRFLDRHVRSARQRADLADRAVRGAQHLLHRVGL